jgi:hypothetical protein
MGTKLNIQFHLVLSSNTRMCAIELSFKGLTSAGSLGGTNAPPAHSIFYLRFFGLLI